MTERTDAEAEAAATLARIDAQVAEAEARRAGIDQLAGEINLLAATASSPQGEVTAEALSGGRVLSVAVTDRALQLSTSRLSQLLTDTVAEAQRKAAMAAVERSAEILGAESQLVEQLRVEASQAFPAPGNGSGEIGYR